MTRLTPFLEIHETLKGRVGFERTHRVTGDVVPLDADKAETILVKLTGTELVQALFENLVLILCHRARKTLEVPQ